jgi:hypothetical protein
VYEPDEERDDGQGADERPTIDWDAWEKNRLRNPWTRLWLLLMLVSAVSMLALYVRSGGTAIPWGPPSK